jgi:hypothetical protein
MQTLGKLLAPLSLAPAAVQDTVVRSKANLVPFVTIILTRPLT